MFDIHTIVCPIDFSDGASAAVDHAMNVAEKFGATVHLVHVVPIDDYIAADGGLVFSKSTVEDITGTASKKMESIAAPHRAKGRKVEVVVRSGRPAEQTIELAESLGAELIVIGTHGRTGLARVALGSVAERVVRTSPIPVLTVRMKA